jgi:hypothetical protein
VETRLLVDSIEESRLLTLFREQRCAQIKLEPLRNLVLELHLGFENVGSGPSLGEDEAILEVAVLGLDVSGDSVGLGLATLDFESHAGGCLSLNLQRGAMEVVVLAKEVIGGLAEILAFIN